MEGVIYQRLGGADAVERLVADFYDKVLSDAELAPFFVGANVDRLQGMQRELFAAALGGPDVRTPADIQLAHAGRGISVQHYNRFVELLVSTLRTFGLDEAEIESMLDRMAVFASDVTGEGVEVG